MKPKSFVVDLLLFLLLGFMVIALGSPTMGPADVAAAFVIIALCLIGLKL